MIVMEELKKRNLTWEQFIASANLQLDVTPTPQSKVQSPLPASSVAQTETSKKRKGKHIAQEK